MKRYVFQGNHFLHDASFQEKCCVWSETTENHIHSTVAVNREFSVEVAVWWVLMIWIIFWEEGGLFATLIAISGIKNREIQKLDGSTLKRTDQVWRKNWTCLKRWQKIKIAYKISPDCRPYFLDSYNVWPIEKRILWIFLCITEIELEIKTLRSTAKTSRRNTTNRQAIGKLMVFCQDLMICVLFVCNRTATKFLFFPRRRIMINWLLC